MNLPAWCLLFVGWLERQHSPLHPCWNLLLVLRCVGGDLSVR